MDESILTSIKKLIGGIAEDDTSFDTDIIMGINSTFVTLQQLGVGPKEGFEIHDKTTTWSEYIKDDKLLNNVKTYVYLKVRIVFDPPSNSTLVDSVNKLINELEWRINVMVDSEKKDNDDESQIASSSEVDDYFGLA